MGSYAVKFKLDFQYFITFVDDCSRVTWLYLMKSHYEIFSIFQNFCSEIKTQFNTSMKILRSDNAKEYFSSSFTNFMIEHDIIHQHSCAHSSIK